MAGNGLANLYPDGMFNISYDQQLAQQQAQMAQFSWTTYTSTGYDIDFSPTVITGLPQPLPASTAKRFNDPRDWLRNRVREITDLAPKGA